MTPNYAVYRKQLKSLSKDMKETDIYQWYMGVVESGWMVQHSPALGDDGKYHYIYITERDDGKIYVGKRTTDNLNDGYIGSGYDIQDGVKAGRKFTNTKLQFFHSSEEAYEAEKKIVNAAFLTSPLVLNHVEGGITDNPDKPEIKNAATERPTAVRSGVKKKFWTFSALHRKPGDVLTYVDDPKVECVVLDDVNVSFKGEKMTLMQLDARLNGGAKKYKNSLNGFKYGDKTLNDIKLEIMKETYGESL